MISQAHLSMMEGCLFVLFSTYQIHGRGMLQIMLSKRRVAWAWCAKVIEY
jgi:hypothetical protein